MNHRATPRFWDCYRRLPAEVPRLYDLRILFAFVQHEGQEAIL